jgi:hypothetical protein
MSLVHAFWQDDDVQFAENAHCQILDLCEDWPWNVPKHIKGYPVSSYCGVCSGAKGKKFDFCICKDNVFAPIDCIEDLEYKEVRFPLHVANIINGYPTLDACQICDGEFGEKFDFCVCEDGPDMIL